MTCGSRTDRAVRSSVTRPLRPGERPLPPGRPGSNLVASTGIVRLERVRRQPDGHLPDIPTQGPAQGPLAGRRCPQKTHTQVKERAGPLDGLAAHHLDVLDVLPSGDLQPHGSDRPDLHATRTLE